MKKEEKEIKLYDDVNLVEYRKDLEGWTGSDGLYYGKDELGERRARYANSTHKKCDCGEVIDKHYVRCSSCSAKKSKERFLGLEQVEWDGESMMTLWSGDEFFSDMNEVEEYCDENEIEIKDLQLILCEKRVDINEINIDELNEEYCTEDGDGVTEFHPEIAKKVDELNELIRNATPRLWFGTDKRIKI